MPWWWSAVMALIITMVIYQLWRNVQQRRWDSKQPLHSLQVVIAKREQVPVTKIHSNKENENRHIRYRYFVEFRPQEGGESRRFQVKKAQFEQLELNLRGELTIQGSRLISFKSAELNEDTQQNSD
ncbi:DUF2500 family protein [Agarivorans sp. MS3-6]|uniref:DUF2500 family protein n=1 Tax=Agarivorans sp. TSD2052 TaxID=2937286 RepID=UPI00200C2408|nr:DUF2500 family protein [Agarivorans sp. TSD2052]UPW18897.1 DUF2500 domain-containing protein [Agarivorans sp. TSD2052]